MSFNFLIKNHNELSGLDFPNITGCSSDILFSQAQLKENAYEVSKERNKQNGNEEGTWNFQVYVIKKKIHPSDNSGKY